MSDACAKVVVITPSTNMAVVLQEPTTRTIVLGGQQGVKGADGVMSEAEVIALIQQHRLHAESSVDAIAVDGTGNISLVIGTLQTIP